MKVELFPFQKMALFQLRRKTAEALGSYQRTHTPQVLSFTAPTGAGKALGFSGAQRAVAQQNRPKGGQDSARPVCDYHR